MQIVKKVGLSRLIIGIAWAIIFFVAARDASAQNWSQCPTGEPIVRCATYDCPNGDTNSDGECSIADTGARLTDSRNDAFCANPLSGCGQVHYYKSGDTKECSVRVKENGLSCDLYNASTPNFTPVPTITPRPTATPTNRFSTLTPSPSPTPVATDSGTTKGGIGGGDSSLPETGPAWLDTLLLGGVGLFGIYLYERFKFE